MKITITESMFKESFANHAREHNFSDAALSALFEHLKEMEESSEVELELNPVALCCELSESKSAYECLRDYMTPNQIADQFVEAMAEGDDELEAACLEYLNENTFVIEFEGGIIIQDF